MHCVLAILISDHYTYISRILFYVMIKKKQKQANKQKLQCFLLEQKPNSLQDFLLKNQKVPGLFFLISGESASPGYPYFPCLISPQKPSLDALVGFINLFSLFH